MAGLSAMTKERLRRFRANRRGFWSLWVFLALFVTSLFAEFIANDRGRTTVLGRKHCQRKKAKSGKTVAEGRSWDRRESTVGGYAETTDQVVQVR